MLISWQSANGQVILRVVERNYKFKLSNSSAQVDNTHERIIKLVTVFTCHIFLCFFSSQGSWGRRQRSLLYMIYTANIRRYSSAGELDQSAICRIILTSWQLHIHWVNSSTWPKTLCLCLETIPYALASPKNKDIFVLASPYGFGKQKTIHYKRWQTIIIMFTLTNS